MLASPPQQHPGPKDLGSPSSPCTPPSASMTTKPTACDRCLSKLRCVRWIPPANETKKSNDSGRLCSTNRPGRCWAAFLGSLWPSTSHPLGIWRLSAAKPGHCLRREQGSGSGWDPAPLRRLGPKTWTGAGFGVSIKAAGVDLEHCTVMSTRRTVYIQTAESVPRVRGLRSASRVDGRA
jgi:hypothetical protein